MGLRLLFCKVIGTGHGGDARAFPPIPPDPFRPKIDDIVGLTGSSTMIPTNPDGTLKFNWCIVLARASDWSAIDADPENVRVFGIDLPDSIDSFEELRSFLRTKTVSDIPIARRQELQQRLEARGLDTSQITLGTTLWQIVRGIYRHLNGGELSGDGPRC